MGQGPHPPATLGANSQSRWALSPIRDPERGLSNTKICSRPVRGLHHAQDKVPVSEGLALLSTPPSVSPPSGDSVPETDHSFSLFRIIYSPTLLCVCGRGSDLA